MTTHSGDRPVGSVAIVVAAGGRGERLGGESPKALECIAGRSLLAHTLDQIEIVRDLNGPGQVGVGQVVVVAPPGHLAEVAAICDQASLPTQVVVGGILRRDSVGAALEVLRDEIEIVLVHDAARALTPARVFLAVIDAVGVGHVAVIPGLPVIDTIKQVDERGIVVSTVDRVALRAIQTPQGFARATLVEAHRMGSDNSTATDDAGLVEASGEAVLVIAGDREALKITTPDDLVVAESIARMRSQL